jgi:hypothetical protein
MTIPPYAWTLAFLPGLRVFGGNIERLSVSWLFFCLAVSCAIYFAGRAILRAIVKDPNVADLLWGLFFVCVMVGGFFFPTRGNELLWIGLCAAAGVAVASAVPLRRIAAGAITVFAGVGCAVPAFHMLTSSVWFERPAIRQMTAHAFAELPQPSAATKADRRDIYYLIFDRYARADQLKDIYAFDNSYFIEQLKARGLHVAEQSFSNYQRTTHSLISSLNLDYLYGLDGEATQDSQDWLPLYEMLQDFRLRRFLDQQGYRFHFFGSWWEPTRLNRLADVNHNLLAIPEPFRVMLDHSLIPFLTQAVGVRVFDHRLVQCQRSQRAFAELRELAASPHEGPRFIFAHLLVPHPPFVMDKNGRCIDAEEARTHTRAENYTQQVQYTNREILKFLDVALGGPGAKPIIVIQSDEGPWPKRFAGDEITTLGMDVTPADWREATRAELVEKMAILNALYLPDRTLPALSETASPVNTFRTVLREYFGVPLAPLEDRQIIFESAQRLYRFHDVTEELAGGIARYPARGRTAQRPQ